MEVFEGEGFLESFVPVTAEQLLHKHLSNIKQNHCCQGNSNFFFLHISGFLFSLGKFAEIEGVTNACMLLK